MGLLIFGAFAVGLKAANLETNVEELWVEGKRPGAASAPFVFLPFTAFDEDICQHAPRAPCSQRSPCPHQGRLFIVCTAGQQPGPPDKGRAVIYSGRCALLGVVRESGGGAGALRGTDHSAGPWGWSPRPATAACLGLAREPRPGKGLSDPGAWARLLSPNPPPTHCVCGERRGGVEGKATPLAAGSVRAPGARRGRAPRGPAEAAACVVLFLDCFQLWGEKNICLKVPKKEEAGRGRVRVNMANRLNWATSGERVKESRRVKTRR